MHELTLRHKKKEFKCEKAAFLAQIPVARDAIVIDSIHHGVGLERFPCDLQPDGLQFFPLHCFLAKLPDKEGAFHSGVGRQGPFHR